MPSSKFNQTPTPRLRPAICVAPAGSCLPPFDLSLPPTLTGSVAAVDLFPPTPYAWHAELVTDPMTTPPKYSAALNFAEGNLTVTVERQLSTAFWTVTLSIHVPPEPPGEIQWPNVFVDPDKDFIIRPLTRVFVPAMNYYRAAFLP